MESRERERVGGRVEGVSETESCAASRSVDGMKLEQESCPFGGMLGDTSVKEVPWLPAKRNMKERFPLSDCQEKPARDFPLVDCCEKPA